MMCLASLALAADGSYHLLEVLRTGEAFGLDTRLAGAWARQALVVVAVRTGVTDTHVLTLLFGAGQLLLPAIAWSLAILLSRADRLVFAAVTMVAGLCAGAAWFFNALESVVAVPLTCLVAVLLWLPRTWRLRELALAALTSAVLVATYETALVTGVVLGLWAVLRARRAHDRLERLGCAAVAALSALSVLVAAVGTQLGASPTHSQSVAYFVASLEPWPFYLALVGIVAVLAALGPWLVGRSARWATLGGGCVALAVSVVSFDPGLVTAFQARGGTAVAALALLGFLFWRWLGADPSVEPHDTHAASRLLVTIPVLFVAAMVVVNIQPVRSWSRSLDAFRSAVAREHGVVVAVEVLPPHERAALWSWTNSSLSVIVRPRPDAAVLVNRDPLFVPFPPLAVRSQLDDAYTWDD
jgi:hypothetical protein